MQDIEKSLLSSCEYPLFLFINARAEGAFSGIRHILGVTKPVVKQTTSKLATWRNRMGVELL